MATWMAGIGCLTLVGVALGGAGDKAQIAELAEALRDQEGSVRRRAVRDLALLDERDAWELVIEALSDPRGEVADEAQFQLAGLGDERLLRDLFGKRGLGGKDPLVRLRVAELFGRSRTELDAVDLLGRLSRRDEEMSEALLWSIERLAATKRLGGDHAKCARGLVKLIKQKGPPRLRAQALCTLAVVAPAEVDSLLPRALDAREHELRVAALDCARLLDSNESFAIAHRLRADPHSAVRFAALEVIAGAGDKAALLALLERLEVEERLRLQFACVEFLQQLSGRKHKLDARPWRHWISSLPEDWTVADRVAPQRDVGGTASFAGLPILSDRVCFLIDFSGSLWYEREDRPARKGKVDELLRAALPRLDESTEFNIIPYTAVPHPWRDEIVPATRRNVNAALADFEANTEKGSGNVFDAIVLALSDPNVDRIVVLTDGAPTGGARWKLELMVPLVRQAARFDRVAFDAIVVDAKPGLRKHWERLCESTGGRVVAVDL